MKWILASTAAIVAGRCFVPGHDLSLAGSYEAIAHIWVGCMLTVGLLKWKSADGITAAACLAVATVFETAMFLAR